MSQPQYIHAGHRQRMREEYISSGAVSFNDIRILEMLLFYAIKEGDTNPLAHKLLDHFDGSLYNVLTADIPELEKVPGIGPYTAVLIHMVGDIYKKAIVEKQEADKNRVLVTGTSVAGKLVCSYFAYETSEKFIVFFLDSNNALLGTKVLGEGVVNSVNVDIRKVIEECIHYNCSGVIIAHNHPDGNVRPSQEDINLTNRIRSALDNIGIYLLDHVIVSGDNYLSFAAEDYL